MKGINQIMRRFVSESYFLKVFQEKLLKKTRVINKSNKFKNKSVT